MLILYLCRVFREVAFAKHLDALGHAPSKFGNDTSFSLDGSHIWVDGVWCNGLRFFDLHDANMVEVSCTGDHSHSFRIDKRFFNDIGFRIFHKLKLVGQ